MKRYIIAGSALVLLFAIAWLFLFGKLFPFSPILIGFNKVELSNINVYAQRSSKIPDLTEINSMIPEIEKFHELKFLHKPELIVFKDSLSYIHRAPSKARFCAFSSSRLLISPWAVEEAREEKISMNIYVKHELSHVLILPHKGFIGALLFPKWLLEGIAVYSADQMGTSFYPDKKETLYEISKGNFMPPEYFKTRRDETVKLNVKYPIAFQYSEFACMVDYLILKYGKAKFLYYLKGLLDSNHNDEVFRKVYGHSFSDFIKDFRNYADEYSKPNNKANEQNKFQGDLYAKHFSEQRPM